MRFVTRQWSQGQQDPSQSASEGLLNLGGGDLRRGERRLALAAFGHRLRRRLSAETVTETQNCASHVRDGDGAIGA